MQLGVHAAAFLAVLTFNEMHTFGYLAYVVTFLLGVQDAAI